MPYFPCDNLPCNSLPCYHLRNGKCFFKQKYWGKVNQLDACPMLQPGGGNYCPVCGKKWWWVSMSGAVHCRLCGFYYGTAPEEVASPVPG